MFKIGDKVKGFKFDGDEYPMIGWTDEMDDVVGAVGEVNYIGGESYSVHFEGVDVDWSYPRDLWYLGKVEETTSFNVGEDVSFHIGDHVKFKKSSIDSGMIDATEDDVFIIENFQNSAKTMVLLEGQYFAIYNAEHLEHVKEELMNNTEEQEIDWQVGQEVFCLLRGKGVVHQVYNTGVDWSEGVDVYFMNHGIIRFKFDGTTDIGFNRSLFFSEPKIEAEKFPPKKPFTPTLKEGDVILAKDYRGFRVIRVSSEDEHFVYNEDGTGFGKSGWEFRTVGEEIIFN